MANLEQFPNNWTNKHLTPNLTFTKLLTPLNFLPPEKAKKKGFHLRVWTRETHHARFMDQSQLFRYKYIQGVPKKRGISVQGTF